MKMAGAECPDFGQRMKTPPYEADIATQIKKLTEEVRRLRQELRESLSERRHGGMGRLDEPSKPPSDENAVH